MPGRAKILAEILRIHGELVTSGAALSVILTHLIQGACKLAQVKPEFGIIRIVDPDRNILRQDIRGDGWGRVLGPGNKVPLTNTGVVGRVIRTHQWEIVKDVREDSDYLALSPDIRSELAIPLLLEGHDRCWGVLNLESADLNHFKKSLVPWMQTLATQAVLTIQHDDLQNHLKQIEFAEAIGIDANKLKANLARIAADAISVLRDKGASVEVLVLSDRRDALVTLAFFTDNPLGAIPGHIAPDSTLAWQAIKEHQVVSYPDIALDEQPARTSVSDSRAALVFPLYDLDDAIIGAFNVEAPTAHALDGVEPLLRDYCTRAEEVLHNRDATTRLPASTLASVMKEVGELITNIVSPSVPEAVYQQVLRRTVEIVGRHDIQAAIAFLNHGKLVITSERTYNYKPHPEGTWTLSRDRTVADRAVMEKTSVLVSDIQASESGYLPQAPSSRCELAVPLKHQKAVIGVILLLTAEPGAINKGHQEIIEYLADQVVHARVHANQIEQWQQEQELLAIIQRTNKASLEMLLEQNLEAIRHIRDQVLRGLIHHAKEITNTANASIRVPLKVPPGPSRVDEKTETEMVLLLVDPPPREADVKEQHFPITRGIVSQAYLTKETQQVKDVEERRDQYVDSFPETRSELAVPMYNGDRVVGVFNLESSTAQTYSHEQVQRVELLASQAANIITFSEAHLFRRQLEVLQKLEQGIIENTRDDDHLTPDSLFQPILQAALELTEQPDGYASLWLTHGGTLRRDAFTKHSPSSEKLAFQTRLRLDSPPALDSEDNEASLSAGLVGLADVYQEPMLASDIVSRPWKDKVTLSWHLAKSGIAVPLIDPTQPEKSPARVVGVLSVQSRHKRAFNERHLQILQLLAQTALVSLRNRALYRSKITMLRDITHAFEKIRWPLRIAAADLRRRPYDPTQVHAYDAEKYVEKAEEIASLTDLAGNLIDWFYQLVKYEVSDFRTEMEPTSMNDLVQQIIKRMDPFASYVKKDILLEERPQDFQVICNPDLVKAVLFLLIENALTYSPDKDTILVRLRQMAHGGAQIEVIDHGDPIREEDRDFLFDPGFRGSAVSSLQAGGRGAGSGIGLDHVRRIVEKLHHGEAGYRALKDGNLFYIQLPQSNALPGELEPTLAIDLSGKERRDV